MVTSGSTSPFRSRKSAKVKLLCRVSLMLILLAGETSPSREGLNADYAWPA
jgi:hypothetical protein